MLVKRAKLILFYLFLISVVFTGMSLSKYSTTKSNGSPSARVARISVDASSDTGQYLYTGENVANSDGTSRWVPGAFQGNNENTQITQHNLKVTVNFSDLNEVKYNYQFKIVIDCKAAANYMKAAAITSPSAMALNKQRSGTVYTFTSDPISSNSIKENDSIEYTISLIFSKKYNGTALTNNVDMTIKSVDVIFTQVQ